MPLVSASHPALRGSSELECLQVTAVPRPCLPGHLHSDFYTFTYICLWDEVSLALRALAHAQVFCCGRCTTESEHGMG